MAASTGDPHREEKTETRVSTPRGLHSSPETHSEHKGTAQQIYSSLRASFQRLVFASARTTTPANSTFQYDLWHTKGKNPPPPAGPGTGAHL